MQGQAILIDSIQKLLRRNADRNLAKILSRTHAADIAHVLRVLSDRDALRVFELVPDLERQAEVLAEADPEIQERLLANSSDEAILELLKQMYGDDAADIIERMPEERAAKILSSWKGEEADSIDTLLGYEPDTAGGIMSVDIFALPGETTASEAIATLQANHEDLEMAFYLYVVNEHGHLIGVCSLRQLVVSDPDDRLASFMIPDVVSVNVATDQEDVARLVAKYNLLAIPVVDDTNRLMGVVTVDDIIDVIREEATEDMLMMAGAGRADFSEQQSARRNFKTRMPWLLATFCGGIGSMFIIGGFEDQLEKIPQLAAFIPITIGMGGNVGTQAATIMTRGLALGRINVSRFASVVAREVATGAMLGLVYGLLLGLVAFVRYPSGGVGFEFWQLAATVSLAVATSMTIAATVGGAVPILFEKIGVDPAVATGPVVTTGVDMLGITIFFVIGLIFLPV